MPPTLEECISYLGREQAAAILAPHVEGKGANTKQESQGGYEGVVAPQALAELPFKHVACIGTGTVGASWAAFFASQGLQVSMYDSNASARVRGLQTAKDILTKMEATGLLPSGAAEPCAKLLKASESMEEAVCNADFVQETVFEDYKVKNETWQAIEANAPASAVIASSTSGLLISKLASVLKHPERALVAHPFNPPHLIRLVELVPGPNTDAKVMENAKNFYRLLGKAPVVLLKEVYGHLANRLQAAVWREAVSLVHQGVASVADVDTSLHEGPGVRWAIFGMHAIFDLGGGEAGYRGFFDGPIGKGCYEPVWSTMEAWQAAPTDAKEACIDGICQWHKEMGKSRSDVGAWRDARLPEILAIKARNPLA